MMKYQYIIEPEEGGVERGPWDEFEYEEAKSAADEWARELKKPVAVIQQTFTYTDSEMVYQALPEEEE